MKSRLFYLFLALMVVLLAGCGSSTESKPVATNYPNAGLMVTTASLNASIAAGAAATGVGSSATPMIVIDARSASAYGTSHIPGAYNLVHSDYWTKGAGLIDTATLAGQLGNKGITRRAKIIIYDDTVNSWGAAGRIFWMLEYLGCTDVHILNGGWDKWVADNRPTESITPVPLPPATFTPQVVDSRKATSGKISDRMYDQDFAVIDSRTDEEYVGWQLYGETRPGHIPGAINLPYAGFYNSDKTTLDYSSLKQLFESRGITPDKEVTAYCTAGIRSGYVYFLLRLMGYPRCSNYDASIWDWADNTTNPMEYAKNYQLLVHPAWVQQLISTGTAPTLPAGNNYKIFECGWGPTSGDYDGGHVPGAIHFDTNNVEARNYLDPTNPFSFVPPVPMDKNEIVWDLVSDAFLQARFAAMGVGNNTTVIVYGYPIAATRVYWAMRYAGVDVRYLNGGMDYWKANGGTVETTANLPPTTPVAFTINPHPQMKALTPEIMSYATYFRANQALQPGTVLVDVRTKDEYAGLITGYSYDTNITRLGRIPGAVWGHDADTNSDFIDADGTLRSYTEVRQMWGEQGITRDKTVIFYCGTGWRSTLGFFYADLMGWPNIKNYDSWYVWSTYYNSSDGTIHRDKPVNDPNMPVDKGWPGP